MTDANLTASDRDGAGIRSPAPIPRPICRRAARHMPCKRTQGPFDGRTDPSNARAVLFTALFFGGVLTAQTTSAQERHWPAISGSATIMRSLTTPGPTDVVGSLVIDPSRRAFAPWMAVGLRWDDLSDKAAYPMGSLGLRFRSHSVSASLGFSGDVVYRSLRPDTADNDPGTMSSPSAISIAPVNPRSIASTRAGYTRGLIADLVTSAEWSTRRLALGIQAGWRLAGKDDGKPWLRATVATPLATKLAVVARLDRWREPALSPSAARLAVGFTWRSLPWGHQRPLQPPRKTSDSAQAEPAAAMAFSVQRLPHGIRLHLLVPAARKVELRSDLTDWATILMRKTATGAWQIDLEATPGVHRLVFRIDDGPWLPPPGLPIGSDGYGGRVGVLIVGP